MSAALRGAIRESVAIREKCDHACAACSEADTVLLKACRNDRLGATPRDLGRKPRPAPPAEYLDQYAPAECPGALVNHDVAHPGPCKPLPPAPSEERRLLERLGRWEREMGGWEAPVWKALRRYLRERPGGGVCCAFHDSGGPRADSCGGDRYRPPKPAD